jgi:hypothetical protein
MRCTVAWRACCSSDGNSPGTRASASPIRMLEAPRAAAKACHCVFRCSAHVDATQYTAGALSQASGLTIGIWPWRPMCTALLGILHAEINACALCRLQWLPTTSVACEAATCTGTQKKLSGALTSDQLAASGHPARYESTAAPRLSVPVNAVHAIQHSIEA